MARKHAGGNGADGFAISMPVLFEKSGAEGTYRRFKFEILRIISAMTFPDSHSRQGKGKVSRSFICSDAIA